MSGMSMDTTCPNCGGDAELYSDYKPFDYSSITCCHCGLMIYPVIKYMTLKGLNEERTAMGLPKLKRKPVQSKNIW